jgi:transposase
VRLLRFLALGGLTATAIVATVADARSFRSKREFAHSWPGPATVRHRRSAEDARYQQARRSVPEDTAGSKPKTASWILG